MGAPKCDVPKGNERLPGIGEGEGYAIANIGIYRAQKLETRRVIRRLSWIVSVAPRIRTEANLSTLAGASEFRRPTTNISLDLLEFNRGLFRSTPAGPRMLSEPVL